MSDFVCEFCGKKYQTSQKLHDHKMANHWKLIYPKKKGKPSKKKKVKADE